MLYRSQFTSPLYQWLFLLSVILFKPFWICYDSLLSLGIASTVEKRKPLKLFIKRFCFISPLLILLVTLFPFAVIGYLMRCALYYIKNPYRLSVKQTSYNQQAQQKLSKFCVGTMNICLLPEYIARGNNLPHTSFRAEEIGKKIVVDQMFHNEKDELNESLDLSLATGVAIHFPAMEFICIQEVWQSDYSDILKEQLHKIYPYIICDVGIYNMKSNYFCLNSGLMLASKYEILDANFQYFGTSCKQCLYTSKGLLMVKVLLWYESVAEDKAVVGYLYTTHLQAYQGKECVSSKQLDDISKWTGEFREATKKSNDVIAFDIICGDFNFDNISPGEQVAREHVLFEEYRDEGREKCGIDKDWTVGTEMRQHNMYNDEVLTPEGLKSCLESPLKRQQYLVDADIVEASIETIVYAPPKTKLSPVGGKRRIDYILYNNNFPVIPTKYKFLTQLTTLTDHIPVAMQFKLPEILK